MLLMVEPFSMLTVWQDIADNRGISDDRAVFNIDITVNLAVQIKVCRNITEDFAVVCFKLPGSGYVTLNHGAADLYVFAADIPQPLEILPLLSR